MIKAIFFDFAGVLVREGFTAGVKEYEKKHRIPDGQLYHAVHDFSHWKDFSLGNISEEKYWRSVSEHYPGELDTDGVRAAIFKNFSPHKEVIDFARELKKNFVLGIISNVPKEWFVHFSKAYDLDDIFTVKAISSYIHVRKPDIKIFQHALQEARAKGPEAIYIDDSPKKVEGAKSLELKIIIYENFPDLKNKLGEIFKDN